MRQPSLRVGKPPVANSDGSDRAGPAGRRAVEAAGRESWQNLVDLDAQLHENKGVRLLTPEARVLIHLKLNGSMTVTEAMEKAGVSYRGFYTVLDRLKQAGLVGQAKDKDDQRVRQLSLDPSMPLTPDQF